MSDTGTDPTVEPIDPPDDTNPGTSDVQNPDPEAGDLAMIDPPDDTGGGTSS
jgi:hypothetical protein